MSMSGPSLLIESTDSMMYIYSILWYAVQCYKDSRDNKVCVTSLQLHYHWNGPMKDMGM